MFCYGWTNQDGATTLARVADEAKGGATFATNVKRPNVGERGAFVARSAKERAIC